jgi:hypothetical protein
VIARSPRTEAARAARLNDILSPRTLGPSPSRVDRARSREWNSPPQCHISCPIRATSSRAPPREPSQPCGRQTTYPALDAARRREFRREFRWIWEAADEGQLRRCAASLKAQHNLPYADCFAAAGSSGPLRWWKSSKANSTACWPTRAGRRRGGTGCAPLTCPSPDGFFRHLRRYLGRFPGCVNPPSREYLG